MADDPTPAPALGALRDILAKHRGFGRAAGVLLSVGILDDALAALEAEQDLRLAQLDRTDQQCAKALAARDQYAEVVRTARALQVVYDDLEDTVPGEVAAEQGLKHLWAALADILNAVAALPGEVE